VAQYMSVCGWEEAGNGCYGMYALKWDTRGGLSSCSVEKIGPGLY